MVSHLKHRFDHSNNQQNDQEPEQQQAMARNRATHSTESKADGAEERDNTRSYIHPASSKNTVTLVLPRWLICYLPTVVTICSFLMAGILAYRQHYMQDNSVLEKTDTFGWQLVEFFSDFDKDGDFYLSFDEALPLLQQFLDKSKGQNDSFQADVDPEEDVVTIDAKFSPLNLSTMTKDWEHDINNNESFHGLFNWLVPHIKTKEFGVSRFLDLLPNDLENIAVPGTVYTIVAAPSGMFGTSSLSSNRYYPPRVIGRGNVLHRLLSMLHPRPFLVMRFPPQGVLGCVRAVSNEYVEVVFRMHAEFQLNEPPRFPFWFTPAQFTGSLLMTRNGSRVERFHIYVPNERSLNVDMEWLDGNPENMEVDIGYLPLMELASLGHSKPQRQPGEGQPFTDEGQHLDRNAGMKITWDMEISYQKAREALELKLFPFKQVKYFNLSEAFEHAKAEDKLVHSILLWGALDDQSC